MTRKYTKRNTAYWNSKKNKVKIVRNKGSKTVFYDRGKYSYLQIISDSSKPLYQHKRG